MREWWPRAEIIVPVFIVRTCLMNSSAPLMKSILMDYVSKRNRAKWASLDSVARFGWSGSAVAGEREEEEERGGGGRLFIQTGDDGKETQLLMVAGRGDVVEAWLG